MTNLRPAISELQTDNSRTRITKWRLPPQSETGHHRHEYDYAIVPITGGALTITEKGETKTAPLEAGKSYFRPAGVEHNVQNTGKAEIIFIEVEIK